MSSIRCQNGEIVRSEYQSSFINQRLVSDEQRLRREITKSCRQIEEPFCSDKSDVTPETCAWACLSSSLRSSCVSVGRNPCEYSWACPGEARCISREKICDGVKDCGNGQDEDKKLCTEDFCKNGFVSLDNNSLNFTTWSYTTDTTQLWEKGIFSDYRYPHAPSKNIEDYRYEYTTYDGKTIISSLQNWMTPKCNHSTKCLRRNSWDEDSDHWIKC